MSNQPPDFPPSNQPPKEHQAMESNPYASPHSQAPATPYFDPEGDATGGVIPYKNVPALIAYYCGVFSLIPCVGFVLGIVAFVLGILGLKKRKQNPAVKGGAHAWIGIILGGLMALLWGGLMGSVLIAGLFGN